MLKSFRDDNLERDPALEARLSTHLPGEVHAFQRVPSTKDIAHDLAAQGVPEGTIVWAECQTRGRGRLRRTWASPAGGAYFSLILRPTRPLAETPQLSLVAGLAAAETIRELTGLLATVRWPNDLLLDGRKVAGILIENKSGAVVLGVGINVSTDPTQLPDTATSLAASGAVSCNSHHVAGEWCRRFQSWYGVWTARGFAPIRAALRPWIGMFGHPVQISTGSGQVEGTASDLDDGGRLLVRLDSGVVQSFDMGVVTLLR